MYLCPLNSGQNFQKVVRLGFVPWGENDTMRVGSLANFFGSEASAQLPPFLLC